MASLLWIGDAACPSGFARATHGILDTLRHHYDVTVLGINYRGDPHQYPYPIYAAAPGGDMFGVGRMLWMCHHVNPDLIIIQNDGWNIPYYIQLLRKSEFKDVPVVAIVAVDGRNFNAKWLDGISHAIFWTAFAREEARQSGYLGPASVIPLGVDRTIYHPMDQMEARRKILPEKLWNAFIIGNVNRNQPRKRWDLLVKYFAIWMAKNAEKGKTPNAYLFLHTAPTGDTGTDVVQLASYYGIADHIATVEPEIWYGASEEHMAATYNCFDINASTTQGEGFGLTTLESMACGIPQLLPEWSALGEWAKGAAWMVPCTTTAVGPPYVNVLGGIADQEAFVRGLHAYYVDPRVRQINSKAALERASQSKYSWSTIGKQYLESLRCAFGEHTWLDVTVQGLTGNAEICATCGLRRERSEGRSDQSEPRRAKISLVPAPLPAEKENAAPASENSRASEVQP